MQWSKSSEHNFLNNVSHFSKQNKAYIVTPYALFFRSENHVSHSHAVSSGVLCAKYNIVLSFQVSVEFCINNIMNDDFIMKFVFKLSSSL